MHTTPSRRPSALTLALALLAAGVPASGAAQPAAPGTGGTEAGAPAFLDTALARSAGEPAATSSQGPEAASDDPFAEPQLGPGLDPDG
ncbi:MAG: hypothetical protein ACLF0P_17410 [Thermoanaerobaculia bacterium]